MTAWQPGLGAWIEDGGARFRVWAPAAREVALAIEGASPRTVRMERDLDGFASVFVPGLSAGTRYGYSLDGGDLLPDPASRFQPDGVHGPSEVVDPAYAWTDGEWRGLDRDNLSIYELHIGTFTAEGTYAAATGRLDALAGLGLGAIEVMPLADFAGSRNWGYDGVAPYAPSRAYGRPEEFRAFVDRAHALGLGVILDVVYNHFGPDGSYHRAFSPQYFTDRHEIPWGAAINLDGPGSEHVRAYFLENALHWLHEYHVDGLRLDAVHILFDESPTHFLAQLRDETAARRREGQPPPFLLAEEHRNLAHVVRPREDGGYGLDATYADDFHHEVVRLLTGHADSFLADHRGTTADVAVALAQGWTYSGQYSRYERANRGTRPDGVPLPRFMHCLDNHDQVGNRAFGERIHHEISSAAFRAAAAVLLFSAATPMLFQGDEWQATSPFLFFTDHAPDIGRAVVEGRRFEFRTWSDFGDARLRDRIPDPQAESTFLRSKLRWEERDGEPHASMLRLHRALLHLRRDEPALHWSEGASSQAAVAPDEGSVVVRRTGAAGDLMLLMARLTGGGFLDGSSEDVASLLALPEGLRWHVALSTEDAAYALDPLAIEVGFEGVPQWCYFHRPGAIVLRAGDA